MKGVQNTNEKITKRFDDAQFPFSLGWSKIYSQYPAGWESEFLFPTNFLLYVGKSFLIELGLDST